MAERASLPAAPMVPDTRRGKIRVLPCLKCGRRFKSLGPGNRLCDRCRKQNTKIDWGYARLVA